MALASLSLNEEYWENFELNNDDIDFLYTYLLEKETPLAIEELVPHLLVDRLAREKIAAENSVTDSLKPYLPEGSYEPGDELVFSSLEWKTGKVSSVRTANTVAESPFKVIEVAFENGQTREFAAELQEHALNTPASIDDNDPLLNPESVAEVYGKLIHEQIEKMFEDKEDFVFIAGRWFPRPLLLDINIGYLNLAEAVLEMADGGPLPTKDILSQVELPGGDNQKLAEFSLDLALQEDERFDEVGTAGKVSWFLKKQEPADVLKTPNVLRYDAMNYDETVLTDEMRQMVQRLQDEHSSLKAAVVKDEYTISILYPHWQAGTLPLTPNLSKLFPSAYISPRVRFMLVDGETGEKFPGWVVRLQGYVYGLRNWYEQRGVMPGSLIRLKRGQEPGEVILEVDAHRSAKEWVRTALIGADGGVVYAMLKQTVKTAFDDWMMIAMPADTSALNKVWAQSSGKKRAFEQVVVDTLRELSKLNPQGHVHAAELYSAVNVVFRCPPEPLFALLATRPWFKHLGDLHFQFQDTEVKTT